MGRGCDDGMGCGGGGRGVMSVLWGNMWRDLIVC